MAKGKSKGDAEGVETQDEQVVSQDDVISAAESTMNPDPAPPVVEEVEEPDVAAVEEAPVESSKGVKVGDYIDTPYGRQRVRKVFADGLVAYSTPSGFSKKMQLPQD